MREYKVMIVGDLHLSSKNYGNHINYAQETLDIFRKITAIAEENKVTHIIGLGDFTMAQIESLRYRAFIDEELEKQNKLTNGNRYEIRGNHDYSSQHITDYEYYKTFRGMLRCPDYIDIGNTRIHLVSYGDESRKLEMGSGYNMVCAHNYLKFDSTKMAEFYGTSYVCLDDKYKWYGVDAIFCGHIHEENEFTGTMYSDAEHTESKEIAVYYPGCPSRPAYRKNLDKYGHVVIVDIGTDEAPTIDIQDFELLPIGMAFASTEETMKDVVNVMKEKDEVINIEDITENLCKYNNKFGDIENEIDALDMFSVEAREKAKSLYRAALNA